MATPSTAKEEFTWAKPGLGQAMFNGLASLTSIRHNGEDTLTATTVDDNRELLEAVATHDGQPLPQGLIKRKLLDGFSELASRNTSANQVASVAMVEGKNKCELVLARNNCFTAEERRLFEELAVEMHQLSQLTAYGPLVSILTLRIMRG